METESRSFRRAAFAFAVVFAAAHGASAQDRFSSCERFGMHAVAFVGVAGEPIRRTFTIAPDVGPVPLTVTPIRVERVYRGPDAAVLYLQTAVGVQPGRRYLVYGDDNAFGAAREIVVGMPTPIEEAREDLAFLDAAVATNSGGTLVGRLESGRADDSSRPRTPLAGVAIRFTSDATAYETTTDERGGFVVGGVSEGWVRLEPQLPDGWTVETRAVFARNGGCTPVALVAEPNGRIRGRVQYADGRPMTWMVDLVPVDPGEAARSTQRKYVRADAGGGFEFDRLLPGAYLVGVNLLRPPTPATPYPPTYYPGTTNCDEAVPIVVGASTVHDGIDVTLSNPLATGQLDVRVTSPSPATSAWICVRSVPNGGGGEYPIGQTGEQAIVQVVDGGRYRIVAHVDGPGGDFESAALDVTGAPGRRAITLPADRAVAPHPAGDACHAAFSR